MEFSTNYLYQNANKLCVDHGHRLLYLTFGGGKLYGISTFESDTDVIGLMVPSKKSLLLQNTPKNLKFGTKSSGNPRRNRKDDLDMII